MLNKNFVFACVLAVLLLALGVQGVNQQVNLTITNTTITVANGALNVTYNNTPSSQTFQFNTTDCISTAGNYTVNVSTNLDYNLIKQNAQCNLNYTCPQPTCPAPSCPAVTCPNTDYSAIITAIGEAKTETVNKLAEVNSSIVQSKSSGGFQIPKETPFVLAGLAVVGYLTRNKWLPQAKKATQHLQPQQPDDSPK